MRRIILALVGALAVLITGTLPAAAAPLPVTHWRFWTGNICMAIGDPNLNAGAIAAKWNAQSHGLVNIKSANNCVTAGYPPSRRFTIDTIVAQYEGCFFVTNIDGYMLTPNRDGNNNPNNPGEYLYSNNPRVWINYHSKCNAYLLNINHTVSSGIGQGLGLNWTNSAGYNSRVMNQTAYSIQNVPYPDANSGALLNFMYGGGCNNTPDC